MDRTVMRLRTFLPLLAVSGLTFAFAAAAQESFLLRLDLKPNTSDKYKLELVSNQVMSGPPGVPPNIDVKGSMDIEMVTGAVDKGTADVEMKTTNVKIDAGEMSGMMPMDQLPKEIVMKAKLDDRSRLTQTQVQGVPAQAQMMMSMSGSNPAAMFVELPEKPIKIGDTWEFAMPKNPMYGSKEHKLLATLVALKEYDGVPVYEVSVRGNFDFDANMGEIFKSMSGGGGAETPQIDMTTKGTISMTGSSLISRKDGKTYFTTTKLTSRQVVSVMGFDLNIEGVTTVNMKKAS